MNFPQVSLFQRKLRNSLRFCSEAESYTMNLSIYLYGSEPFINFPIISHIDAQTTILWGCSILPCFCIHQLVISVEIFIASLFNKKSIFILLFKIRLSFFQLPFSFVIQGFWFLNFTRSLGSTFLVPSRSLEMCYSEDNFTETFRLCFDFEFVERK